MRKIKKILFSICGFIFLLAVVLGLRCVAVQTVDANADEIYRKSYSVMIENTDGRETYFSNAVALTKGENMYFEMEIDSIEKTEASGGFFAVAGDDENINYGNTVSTGQAAIIRNGDAMFPNEFVQGATIKIAWIYDILTETFTITVYTNDVAFYTKSGCGYQKYWGILFVNYVVDIEANSVKFYSDNNPWLGIKASSNVSYEANLEVQPSEFYMIEGASVRLALPTGIGFISRIDYTLYNKLTTQYENVKLGTLILPYDMLVCDFTHASLKNAKVSFLDIPNETGFRNEARAEQDGYYEYRGSIVNIYGANYGRAFAAVGYICLDGEYYYTPFDKRDHVRSPSDVAYAAYNDVSNECVTGKYGYQITDPENKNFGKYSPYDGSALTTIEAYARLFGEKYTIVYQSDVDYTSANLLAEYTEAPASLTITY